MAIVSVEEFFARLRKSNLLSDEQLAGVEADIAHVKSSNNSEPVVRRLVKEGLLTEWQAQMLVAGRNAFFLGNHKLLDRLGHGGMGTVFKAEHTVLGRIVAIKVMAKRLVKNEKLVARFHQEIQAAAVLDNAHVVRAYDADSVGTTHFLVMEYVDGEPLNSIRQRRGKLPVGEACEYIRQAALGLQHAHERGMIHRDMKPSNLILTWLADDKPQVKILDMGLARFASEEDVVKDGSLTRTGQIMGTPDYMSPEQAWDTKQVDIRGDIYSLGCALFELLTGNVPFQGENALQTLMVRSTADAPPLRQYDPELPAELEALVSKMLARDASQRFQTPAELAAALATFAVAPSKADIAKLEQQPRSVPTAAPTLPEVKGGDTQTEVGYEQFLNDLATQATPSPVEAARANSAGETQELAKGKSKKKRRNGRRTALVATLPENSITDFDQPTTTASAPHSVKMQGEMNRRGQADRKRLLIISSVAFLFVAILGGYAVWPRSDSTNPGTGIAANGGGHPQNGSNGNLGQGSSNPDALTKGSGNQRRLLRELADQTIDEGQRLSVMLKVDDAVVAGRGLKFHLGPDAPNGTNVDSSTGKFTWTPSEEQGPGLFRFSVHAAVHAAVAGDKSLSDSTSLTVTVKEVDRAPILPKVADKLVPEGKTLRLELSATDPDLPANRLRYELGSDAPAGASINPDSGIIIWTPTEAQGPGTYPITVRVASIDAPDLAAETRFQVKVLEVNFPPRLLPISAQAIAAQQPFRLLIKAVDPDIPENRFTFSLDSGAPAGAMIDPVSGQFAWTPTAEQSPGEYQIKVRVTSSDAVKLSDLKKFTIQVGKPAGPVTAGKALPSEQEQEAATKEIRDLFRRELALAKSLPKRAAIAKSLLARAIETDEPATAYVLFEMARDYAQRGRSIETALVSIQSSRERFPIDSVALTLECFRTSWIKGTTLADKLAASEAAVSAAAEAVQLSRLDEASKLLAVAEMVFRSDKDLQQLRSVQTIRDFLDTVKEEAKPTAGGAVELTSKGKLAKGELVPALQRLTFTPLFVNIDDFSFTRHAAKDLPDRGKSVWNVKNGNVRIEMPDQDNLTGFLDKTKSYSNFTLRANVAGDNTTGVLFMGAPEAGKFDGLQIQLRSYDFCQIKVNATSQLVATPAQKVARNPSGWDILEISVEKKRISIRVNGTLVVETNAPVNTSGYLGLDAYLGSGKPTTRFKLRNVRIRED